MKCPQCNGSGKIPLFTSVIDCDACEGTGVKGAQSVTDGFEYSAEAKGHRVTISRGKPRRIVVGPDGQVLKAG